MGLKFGVLKSLIRAKNVTIDDMLFRLHYRATFIIVFGASVLVWCKYSIKKNLDKLLKQMCLIKYFLNLAKGFWGVDIDCISNDDISDRLLRIYCLIHSTFSLDDAWKKQVGVEVAYPGVDEDTPGEKRTYHTYYQWVSLVLFLQALFFYFPRLLWKHFEEGRVEAVTDKLKSDANRDSSIALLANMLTESRPIYRSMIFKYSVLEVLNFLNVIIQIIIMDRFLGKQFITYGWDVLKHSVWESGVRYDPMLKVFPRLTRCTFHLYGSYGDIQKHDAMCILPINTVNEKVYLFLWFWFYFVAVVSLVGLVYRSATLVSPRVRQLTTYSHKYINGLVSRNAFETIIRDRGCDSWFFLDLISRNMDEQNFKQLVIDLDKAIEANVQNQYENKQNE